MERKRRRFSTERKHQILNEHLIKGIPIPIVARTHDINPVTLYYWKRKMSEENTDQIDVKKLLKEIEELKSDKSKLLKKVGELTLSNEVGQDIIDFYKKKILEDQLKERKSSSIKKKKGAKK